MFSQAALSIADAWESTRAALHTLAVDAATTRVLEKRVSALEGVRASDQDICQVCNDLSPPTRASLPYAPT